MRGILLQKLLRWLTPAAPSKSQEQQEQRLLRRPPSGPVLFLDIDGVLHPGQSGTRVLLPLLERWLLANPSVEVVISSNWRETHTQRELDELFSQELRRRVLGGTPVLEGELRLDEILCVVREYGIARWAAVDDYTPEFPDTRRLVATQYQQGLTPQSLQQLSALLGLEGEQPPSF